MGEGRKGSYLRLTPGRKMVLEILHHGLRVPSLPLSMAMNVADVAIARRASRVSWTAVFTKAYGLVAQRRPELRRAYLPLPWPRLYEHPISEASVLVEREHEGEDLVLSGKVRGPEAQPLEKVEAAVRRFREAPLEEVSDFRQWLRFGRLPRPLLRFAFWRTLSFSGYTRTTRFGTFAISSLGGFGVEQHHPISSATTYLTYGPIRPDGEVTVRIIYDHRVMDGRCVARCLNDLQRVLQSQVRDELWGLSRATGGPAEAA